MVSLVIFPGEPWVLPIGTSSFSGVFLFQVAAKGSPAGPCEARRVFSAWWTSICQWERRTRVSGERKMRSEATEGPLDISYSSQPLPCTSESLRKSSLLNVQPFGNEVMKAAGTLKRLPSRLRFQEAMSYFQKELMPSQLKLVAMQLSWSGEASEVEGSLQRFKRVSLMPWQKWCNNHNNNNCWLAWCILRLLAPLV